MRWMLGTVLVLISLCCSQVAHSHPGEKIDIEFNPQSRILEIYIMHPVSSPEAHYIRRVNVALNGKDIIWQEMERQDDITGVSLKYRIPGAKPGDVVRVTAECSKSGKSLVQVVLK